MLGSSTMRSWEVGWRRMQSWTATVKHRYSCTVTKANSNWNCNWSWNLGKTKALLRIRQVPQDSWIQCGTTTRHSGRNFFFPGISWRPTFCRLHFSDRDNVDGFKNSASAMTQAFPEPNKCIFLCSRLNTILYQVLQFGPQCARDLSSAHNVIE